MHLKSCQKTLASWGKCNATWNFVQQKLHFELSFAQNKTNDFFSFLVTPSKKCSTVLNKYLTLSMRPWNCKVGWWRWWWHFPKTKPSKTTHHRSYAWSPWYQTWPRKSPQTPKSLEHPSSKYGINSVGYQRFSWCKSGCPDCLEKLNWKILKCRCCTRRRSPSLPRDK